MAEFSTLDALQAFHQELLAVREGRAVAAETLDNVFLTRAFEGELERLWSKPPKNQESRASLQKGGDNSSAAACVIMAKLLQAKLRSMEKSTLSTSISSRLRSHSQMRLISTK